MDGDLVHHTITNAECSGVFSKNSYIGCSYIFNRPETMVYRDDYTCDYHLFVRCGDKVYMDVKGIGDIVMPFSELQKNKYWKHYYDLSLMLTSDPHLVIQNTKGLYDYRAYDIRRFWAIDTASIYGTTKTDGKEIANRENNCYYKINPFNVETMEYASQDGLNNFTRFYRYRGEINRGTFNRNSRYRYNLGFDYCVSLMEKEVEEFEDRKNLVNLLALNEKKGMNGDVLRMIYDSLVSNAGKHKYAKYVEDAKPEDAKPEAITLLLDM